MSNLENTELDKVISPKGGFNLNKRGAHHALVLSFNILDSIHIKGYREKLSVLSKEVNENDLSQLVYKTKELMAEMTNGMSTLPKPMSIALLLLGTYLGLEKDAVNDYIVKWYSTEDRDKYNGFIDAFDWYVNQERYLFIPLKIAEPSRVEVEEVKNEAEDNMTIHKNSPALEQDVVNVPSEEYIENEEAVELTPEEIFIGSFKEKVVHYLDTISPEMRRSDIISGFSVILNRELTTYKEMKV